MSNLYDLREWLTKEIDGSDETRNRDQNISTFIAALDRHMIRRSDSLANRMCPNCASESYYWLKSSGRCTDCGFHWGID